MKTQEIAERANENGSQPLSAAPCSAEIPECAVEGCKTKAVCLLAVKGEWFPICKEHSTNRLLPRRDFFPPNDTLCRPADSEAGAQKGQSK